MKSLLFVGCSAALVSSSGVQITHDEIGVSFFHDIYVPMNDTLSRRLIDGSASAECASDGGYQASGNCISTNPTGCGCSALTASEKQTILDLHNARRDMAAGGIERCAIQGSGSDATNCPAASNMNYLFWDPALEVVSNFWAHQCIWDHHSTWQNANGAGQYYQQWYTQQSILDNTPADEMYKDQCDAGNCKGEGFSSGWIGENLAASWNGGGDYSMQDLIDGVNGWYDESIWYDWNTKNTIDSSEQVGHWTAGVWARTRYVGCSYAICPGNAAGPWGSQSQVGDWLNFVCKYYPGGNYNMGSSSYVGPYTPTPAPSKCSACESDRQGCISSVTSSAAPQAALCGGPQCSACAVDYNQQSCAYGFASCPSNVFTNDGTVGPAMSPTSRPVSFTGEPTRSPTAPTTAMPTPDGTCSVTTSGFSYGGFNTEWQYEGEHNGRQYYNAGSFFISHSTGHDAYIITNSYTSNSAYCKCEVDPEDEVLTACTAGEWVCWSTSGGSGAWASNPAANVVSNCAQPAPQPVTLPTLAPVTAAPVTAAPVTAAPVTAAPVTAAPVTAAPVTAAPVASPVASEVSTTQDLEVAGAPNRLQRDANAFTNGDADAFAALIVEYGISTVQNVQIEILSRTRGGVAGARTVIIEYELTSDNAADLNTAVANVNTKVSNGAIFQYASNGRTWPFVSNGPASAVIGDEQADEVGLDLLDESSENESYADYVWYAVSAALLLASACGVAGCYAYRKRRVKKEVNFGHVDAEMAKVEKSKPETETQAVSAEAEAVVEAPAATEIACEDV